MTADFENILEIIRIELMIPYEIHTKNLRSLGLWKSILLSTRKARPIANGKKNNYLPLKQFESSTA